MLFPAFALLLRECGSERRSTREGCLFSFFVRPSRHEYLSCVSQEKGPTPPPKHSLSLSYGDMGESYMGRRNAPSLFIFPRRQELERSTIGGIFLETKRRSDLIKRQSDLIKRQSDLIKSLRRLIKSRIDLF